jgi:hypothetical protein
MKRTRGVAMPSLAILAILAILASLSVWVAGWSTSNQRTPGFA